MSKDEVKGILGNILKGLPIQGEITPRIINQNELSFDITEQQFTDLALANTPKEYRDYVKIELHEGKITVRIRII